MTHNPPRPRVLLVEDEPTICDFLCEALSKDYEVVCVSRVDEALRVFARQRIDVGCQINNAMHEPFGNEARP